MASARQEGLPQGGNLGSALAGAPPDDGLWFVNFREPGPVGLRFRNEADSEEQLSLFGYWLDHEADSEAGNESAVDLGPYQVLMASTRQSEMRSFCPLGSEANWYLPQVRKYSLLEKFMKVLMRVTRRSEMRSFCPLGSEANWYLPQVRKYSPLEKIEPVVRTLMVVEDVVEEVFDLVIWKQVTDLLKATGEATLSQAHKANILSQVQKANPPSGLALKLAALMQLALGFALLQRAPGNVSTTGGFGCLVLVSNYSTGISAILSACALSIMWLSGKTTTPRALKLLGVSSLFTIVGLMFSGVFTLMQHPRPWLNIIVVGVLVLSAIIGSSCNWTGKGVTDEGVALRSDVPSDTDQEGTPHGA